MMLLMILIQMFNSIKKVKNDIMLILILMLMKIKGEELEADSGEEKLEETPTSPVTEVPN